jgi:hypothetical protein
VILVLPNRLLELIPGIGRRNSISNPKFRRRARPTATQVSHPELHGAVHEDSTTNRQQIDVISRRRFYALGSNQGIPTRPVWNLGKANIFPSLSINLHSAGSIPPPLVPISTTILLQHAIPYLTARSQCTHHPDHSTSIYQPRIRYILTRQCQLSLSS